MASALAIPPWVTKMHCPLMARSLLCSANASRPVTPAANLKQTQHECGKMGHKEERIMELDIGIEGNKQTTLLQARKHQAY